MCFSGERSSIDDPSPPRNPRPARVPGPAKMPDPKNELSPLDRPILENELDLVNRQDPAIKPGPRSKPMPVRLTEKLQLEWIEWPPGECRHFIPVDKLDEIIGEESVVQELKFILGKELEEDVKRYSGAIWPSFKKLFTILLFALPEGDPRIMRAIEDLVDEEITDVDLPFPRIILDEGNQNRYTLGRKSHRSCPHSSNHEACSIKSISNWGLLQVQKFDAQQWLVFAPVFKSIPHEIPHHELDSGIIMPFTMDLQNVAGAVRAGGYSDVWKVRIHKAHHDLLKSADPRGPLMAVKRLHSSVPEEFKREFGMLSALTLRNNPHLVKLLATYTYRGKYHFIFPYAKSNLRDYWNSIEHPYWNKETYLWTLKQILGLTNGLNEIHNFKTDKPFQSQETNPLVTQKRASIPRKLLVQQAEEKFGRHGDLKPENILWSDDLENAGPDGILQITDFGLGRFHRFESRSRVDPKTLNGSPTYTPPEVSLETPVSRAYDIWSMGCVYLEFLTWLLEGSRGVQEFSTARQAIADDGIDDDTFYSVTRSHDTGRRQGQVRPGVNSWVERLRKNTRCSEVIHDLLNLVHEGMLEASSKDRIKTEVLVSALGAILQKATTDMNYLLGGNPPKSEVGRGVKRPKAEAEYSAVPGAPVIQVVGPSD